MPFAPADAEWKVFYFGSNVEDWRVIRGGLGPFRYCVMEIDNETVLLPPEAKLTSPWISPSITRNMLYTKIIAVGRGKVIVKCFMYNMFGFSFFWVSKLKC